MGFVAGAPPLLLQVLRPLCGVLLDDMVREIEKRTIEDSFDGSDILSGELVIDEVMRELMGFMGYTGDRMGVRDATRDLFHKE